RAMGALFAGLNSPARGLRASIHSRPCWLKDDRSRRAGVFSRGDARLDSISLVPHPLEGRTRRRLLGFALPRVPTDHHPRRRTGGAWRRRGDQRLPLLGASEPPLRAGSRTATRRPGGTAARSAATERARRRAAPPRVRAPQRTYIRRPD